jgi:uncharacterized membrane-anchored protein
MQKAIDTSSALIGMVRGARPVEAPDTVAAMLNKVPAVTLVFWIIKIMSTTVGETGADYLAVHVGLGAALTGGIMVALLAGTLVLQLRSRR